MHIRFQSSDAALEAGGTSELDLDYPSSDFAQLTYAGLRIGPDGGHIAFLEGGCYWTLTDGTGRFFSDVVIS